MNTLNRINTSIKCIGFGQLIISTVLIIYFNILSPAYLGNFMLCDIIITGTVVFVYFYKKWSYVLSLIGTLCVLILILNVIVSMERFHMLNPLWSSLACIVLLIVISAVLFYYVRCFIGIDQKGKSVNYLDSIMMLLRLPLYGGAIGWGMGILALYLGSVVHEKQLFYLKFTVSGFIYVQYVMYLLMPLYYINEIKNDLLKEGYVVSENTILYKRKFKKIVFVMVLCGVLGLPLEYIRGDWLLFSANYLTWIVLLIMTWKILNIKMLLQNNAFDARPIQSKKVNLLSIKFFVINIIFASVMMTLFMIALLKFV